MTTARAVPSRRRFGYSVGTREEALVSAIDIVILALVAAAFVAVALRIRKKGTCGDCPSAGSCGGSCAGCGARGSGGAGCPACEDAEDVARRLRRGVR